MSKKKHTLEPKQGCHCLGSCCIQKQLFAATLGSCRHGSGCGSGGRGVREGGIIIDAGGHCKGLGIGAEFERTRKMESENGSENDHFCKSEGRFDFSKMIIFRFILVSF
jgi:hypothetical protein